MKTTRYIAVNKVKFLYYVKDFLLFIIYKFCYFVIGFFCCKILKPLTQCIFLHMSVLIAVFLPSLVRIFLSPLYVHTRKQDGSKSKWYGKEGEEREKKVPATSTY